MSEYGLLAEARSSTGKGVARRLRAAGRIPGVVYGSGKPGLAVALDARELEKLLHRSGSGMNTLIDLSVGGDTRTVLVKDLQRDPVRRSYVHADFYEVDLEKKITVSVPIHPMGKAKGVELGGILDYPLRELEVECLPRAIPDSIEVDVSELDIGDSIHVRDLALPAGVELSTDPDLAVALCAVPAVEAEPTAEEAEGEAVAGEEAVPAEGEAKAEESKKEEGRGE